VRALAARLQGLDGRLVWMSVSRTLIGSVLMVEVVLLWIVALEIAGLRDYDSKLDAGLALVGGAALGAAAYFFATRALQSEESQVLAERVPLPARVRGWLT
jgi:hypothetical protein